MRERDLGCERMKEQPLKEGKRKIEVKVSVVGTMAVLTGP